MFGQWRQLRTRAVQLLKQYGNLEFRSEMLYSLRRRAVSCAYEPTAVRYSLTVLLVMHQYCVVRNLRSFAGLCAYVTFT